MKAFFIALLILASSFTSFACDICGCGSNSTYIGILPDFRKKFVGFRYRYSSLSTHQEIYGIQHTTREYFHTAELWGAVNLGKRIRLVGFIPVNFIKRESDNDNVSHEGLGDISLIGYYQLINSSRLTASKKSLTQSLLVGSGLKLPTGHYDPNDKNVLETSQNTFQLGTGSFEFSLHGYYQIQLNNVGVTTNVSYRMNTVNSDDYRYGNKTSINLLAYYRLKLGQMTTITPNAGAFVELAQKDKSHEVELEATGGHTLMGNAGIETAIGRVGVGVNFQLPLNHAHEGKPGAENRGMVYLSYSF